MRNFRFFFLILLFCGCHSSHDAQFEADIVICDLISILENVQSKGDLEGQYIKMKNLFNKLTHIMIHCKKYKQKITAERAHILRWELERLYAIEGCRQLIEEAQRDSVHKLDRLNRQSHPVKY